MRNAQLTADPENHPYAVEAEMGDVEIDWGTGEPAAAGNPQPHQTPDTPGVCVFLAGVGYGFVVGIAMTVILS